MRISLVFFFLCSLSLAFSQDKPLSPLETIDRSVDGVDVTIVYCRPSARGRVMIGGKEPFGQVWRTGANAATTIEFEKDVLIDNKPLSAGKYSLFTIPGETEWIVIFNKVHEQWGAYNYDPSHDALRVNVRRQKPKAFVETFTITLGKNNIVLTWENFFISIPVKQQ